MTGTVPDWCERPRCKGPSVLRYLGTALCQKHWDQLCETESRKETDCESILQGTIDPRGESYSEGGLDGPAEAQPIPV